MVTKLLSQSQDYISRPTQWKLDRLTETFDNGTELYLTRPSERLLTTLEFVAKVLGYTN